jgi:predicted pyridoxine 5'-phosphate oxidase superfamily flavin-nucleotide-binding protein
MSAPTILPPSPFHAGELAVQERVGVRDQIDATGRKVVRDYMPDQHRQFFSELSFFFVGALDHAAQPWATMLIGKPGFMATPDERTLRIASKLLPGDPLTGQLKQGDFIGGLGMMPTTRRRNRVNGVITGLASEGLTIAVKQCFGNCPKYIQSRDHQIDSLSARAPQVISGNHLSAEDRTLITRADTFFIASANTDASAGNAGGVDISHRGGRSGFVRIDDNGSDSTLTAPDFIGNSMFNTLGNLLHHPRAGLLFIDFESGDLLHLAVEAKIVWDGPQLKAFAGAERLYRFDVLAVHRNVGALPFKWSASEMAAQLERTGTWKEAALASIKPQLCSVE